MEFKDNKTAWRELLEQAVSEPGLLMQAYRNFHGYSLGNQWAAMMQCHMRGIEPGPIATYKKWLELGRQVQKGSKAIVLCMPVTFKSKKTGDDGEPVEPGMRRYFLWRANWFVISQTEGADYKLPEMPEWDKERALRTLSVAEVTFGHTDGNRQGYAQKGRQIAINPVAQLPHKTLFHELAHILLHTDSGESFAHGETLPRNLREVEAESVAMLVLASLDLPGIEYCRGYIQGWLKGGEITEASSRRIFKAASQILEAGREGKAATTETTMAA